MTTQTVSGIYIEQDVPVDVANIFVPRFEQYMEILEKMHSKKYEKNPREFDGAPFCADVSEIVAYALHQKGVDTRVIEGYFLSPSGFRITDGDIRYGEDNHRWFAIRYRRGLYSIDMTHKQVQGDTISRDQMIIVVNTKRQDSYGLIRESECSPEKDVVDEIIGIKIPDALKSRLLDLFSV